MMVKFLVVAPDHSRSSPSTAASQEPASWLSTAKGQVMANVEQELEKRARVSGKHLCIASTGMTPERFLFTAFGKYTVHI